jgi:hypothetical protein
MRRKFYMYKRGGVFYACLVNQETGLPMGARSTRENDRGRSPYQSHSPYPSLPVNRLPTKTVF